MCMLCMKHVTEEHLVTDTSGGKLILRDMATRWLKLFLSKGRCRSWPQWRPEEFRTTCRRPGVKDQAEQYGRRLTTTVVDASQSHRTPVRHGAELGKQSERRGHNTPAMHGVVAVGLQTTTPNSGIKERRGLIDQRCLMSMEVAAARTRSTSRGWRRQRLARLQSLRRTRTRCEMFELISRSPRNK